MIFSKLRRKLIGNDLKGVLDNQTKLFEEMSSIKIALGNIKMEQIKSKGIVESLEEVEFKVFSQFGDDGIIQYLINNIELSTKTFIEFGVQDYSESNTRFLLLNNNWTGLIIDGNKEDMEKIKTKEFYWRQNLTSVGKFVNKTNINEIFKDNDFDGEIGILSIDIDGNDYWVWEAINTVDPAIVIVEYNSVFGKTHAISVPYDENFYRTRSHFSNLYWGASLKALIQLADRKGYIFVGCNSAGNNAYFVRLNKLGRLKALTVEEGFVNSKFRESRDQSGNLTFVSGENRINLISDCEVFDFDKNSVCKIKDLGN
jgi:hypothetical protein